MTNDLNKRETIDGEQSVSLPSSPENTAFFSYPARIYWSSGAPQFPPRFFP